MNANLVRDVFLNVLILTAGLAGQFILFDPLRVLAPDLPLLSPDDWPGSQLTTPRLIVDGLEWQSQRGFMQAIDQPPRAGVTQVIVWYADWVQAEEAWELHKNEPYFDLPILASSTDRNQPQSILFCTPPELISPRECSYRAYWGNWYTYLEFYGRTGKDLPLSEIQMLLERVDQLLMSAPNKPCQGFFCMDNRPVEKSGRTR